VQLHPYEWLSHGRKLTRGFLCGVVVARALSGLTPRRVSIDVQTDRLSGHSAGDLGSDQPWLYAAFPHPPRPVYVAVGQGRVEAARAAHI
jgi:hypothetical protein